MKLQWKLRERLTALVLAAGLVPLLIGILYVGNRSSALLETQAQEYLKAKVDGFASMAELRHAAIEGSLDIIKEQLKADLLGDILKQAAIEKYFDTGSLAVFKADGTCLYHRKPDYLNGTGFLNTSPEVRTAFSAGQGFVKYSSGGYERIAYLTPVKGTEMVLWGEAPASEILGNVNALKTQMWGFFIVIGLFVTVITILFTQKIASMANDIATRMMDIARGEADLSKRLPVLSTDEVGDIAHWFNEFVGNLEGVIGKVKDAAVHVDSAVQEVAAGSQGFSQATQEQASAIEEVAATIEEMTSSIKQNASNASEGREKAQSMVQMANTSGEASQELVQAMGEISNASKKIGDIIVTVNEVAFQTNLLALNAAVEAARAGEHGKGFAVVAEEVRALAQRSAEASRQIKVLIEDTVSKINAGDDMVKRSGESLMQIISQIQDLSQTMEEIAAASSEQATGIDELNRAVSQIDGTTQHNSATVEQLASTSDSLSNEARVLAETVVRFKVSRRDDPAQARGRVATSPPPAPAAIAARSEIGSTPSRLPNISDDFEEF